MKPTNVSNFWKRTKRQASGCLVWTGYIDRGGYGRHCSQEAHRVAYQLAVGPIAEGLQIDHLCRNRACVEPRHLEAVSQRENILRGNSPAAAHARRDCCAAGHPFTDENTYVWRNHRCCRTCRRACDAKRQRNRR